MIAPENRNAHLRRRHIGVIGGPATPSNRWKGGRKSLPATLLAKFQMVCDFAKWRRQFTGHRSLRRKCDPGVGYCSWS